MDFKAENEDRNNSSTGAGAQNEQLALVKRIFFKTESSAESANKSNVGGGGGNMSQPSQSYSSLIYCLFVNISTDSRSSIEYMTQELFFKFVQNDAFKKYERVRLFNDRTLSFLVKLYNWRETNSSNE